ncbi:Dihydrofolate reductase [compost metagenome]
MQEALDLTKGEENVFVIGGAQIYKEAMNITDKLYITEVKQQFDGDAFFPEIKKDEWEEILRDDHKADEKNKIDYSFVTYKRRN